MYFSSPVEKIIITNKRQQHKNPGQKVTSQRDVNRERKQKKLIRYSKWFERKFSEQFPRNVFLVSYAWTSPDLLECRFCNLFYTLSIKRSRFGELKLVMITIGHLKNILSTSDDSCLRFIHFNTHKYKSWVSSSFFSISKHFCSCQVNVWSRCCERFHFVNHWRKTEELTDWQRDARWKLLCLQM